MWLKTGDPNPSNSTPVMSAVAGLWKAANVKSTCFCFGPAFVFSSQPYCPLRSLSGQHLVWVTCVSEALTQFSAWRRWVRERETEWVSEKIGPLQGDLLLICRSDQWALTSPSSVNIVLLLFSNFRPFFWVNIFTLCCHHSVKEMWWVS